MINMGLHDMERRHGDLEISGVFVNVWDVNTKVSKQKQSNLLSEMCLKLSKRKASLLLQQARMANSLDMKDIRKEQRRVAALLGHEYRSNPYNSGDISHRSEIINFCICSGPDVAKNLCSMHKDKRNRKTNFSHHPRKSLTSARSKSVDSAELQRIKQEDRDNVYLRGQSITPQCRSPTIIKGLPNIKIHDKIKGQDIEDFDYNVLGDTVTNELGGPGSLPGILRKNYNKPQRGLDAPDNTPLMSAKRKKKRRSSKLPSIDGDRGPRNSITVYLNGLNEQEECSDVDDLHKEGSRLRKRGRHFGKQHDYCQCVKPHPELTSPHSNSSGYQSQSDNTPLQRCLKCGKIISKIPPLESNNQQLQQYFDPHASLDNELQHSFISNHSAIDSVSSGSFIRIRDEFNNRFPGQYENTAGSSEQYLSKKENNVKYENPNQPLLENDDSQSDYNYECDETEYDGQSNSVTINEPLQIKSNESSGKNKRKTRNHQDFEIYEDGHKEAYVKALAMAQIPKLPMEPWMLSARISKPHEFSYFQPLPYNKRCKDCDKCMVKIPRTKPDLAMHKLKPKKHIFGNLEVNDFYPGGKRNPLEIRRKYQQNT